MSEDFSDAPPDLPYIGAMNLSASIPFNEDSYEDSGFSEIGDLEDEGHALNYVISEDQNKELNMYDDFVSGVEGIDEDFDGIPSFNTSDLIDESHDETKMGFKNQITKQMKDALNDMADKYSKNSDLSEEEKSSVKDFIEFHANEGAASVTETFGAIKNNMNILRRDSAAMLDFQENAEQGFRHIMKSVKNEHKNALLNVDEETLNGEVSAIARKSIERFSKSLVEILYDQIQKITDQIEDEKLILCPFNCMGAFNRKDLAEHLMNLCPNHVKLKERLVFNQMYCNPISVSNKKRISNYVKTRTAWY